jgi:uncharacterized protein
MLPTRFENLRGLARLPWFELQGERIVADPAIGPAVDLHAHFALSYLLPARVDLQRETERVLHYLPAERPIDLDLYGNRNIPPEDVKRLKRDLTLGSLGSGGMRATHTVPNLAREMRDLGVVAACILPIDFPVLSNNAETKLRAIAGRSDFIGFGSVHPFARDVEGRLDRQIALGARGIKLHPAVQLVAPDHPRAMRLYGLAGARRIPVLWHCGPVGIDTAGGRRRTQVARYALPIERNPETTFILGHAGALQMPEAVELARRYPNVWLEVSCQGSGAIRHILDEVDPERVMWGTDWPFYHVAFGLAKLLAATEDRQELRPKVLHANAARLLGLSIAPRPA